MGRGEKSLIDDPGSEVRLGRETEKQDVHSYYPGRRNEKKLKTKKIGRLPLYHQQIRRRNTSSLPISPHLVKKKNVRLLDQSGRKSDALALPPGEVGHQAVLQILDPQPRHHLKKQEANFRFYIWICLEVHQTAATASTCPNAKRTWYVQCAQFIDFTKHIIAATVVGSRPNN